jgi:hypothetical protein
MNPHLPNTTFPYKESTARKCNIPVEDEISRGVYPEHSRMFEMTKRGWVLLFYNFVLDMAPKN